MKTLFHIQESDLVWDAIVQNKRLTDKMTLVDVCEAAVNSKLKLSSHKKPRALFETEYDGHAFEIDAMPHIIRMINLLNRNPETLDITEDDSYEDILNWFVNEGAPEILKLRNSESKFAQHLCHQLAQVAEKGFKKEWRKMFNIGVVEGELFDGPVYEAVQAQIYKDSGGPGKVGSGKHLHVSINGEIVPYEKVNRKDGGKQLDLMVETDNLVVYTTNKAQTATKDGGARTSEYEQDLGGTLSKRSTRFGKKGFEIVNGKLWLVVGMIDSRFFNNNVHAVRLIQERCGNVPTDTFVSDSKTLAEFINIIDTPEVLKDPEGIITKAFEELAVDI